MIARPVPPLDLRPANRLLERHLSHQQPYEVQLEGIRLAMLPGVFCPAYTKTSAFLARAVQVRPGDRVLDIFCGSGFQGLSAAGRASQVVCIDHSGVAVECARRNAELNGLSHKVDVRCGDLFQPVDGERFDVIVANPPLLPGEPKSLLETAILDPNLRVATEFFSQLSQHLTPEGHAFLVYSDAVEKQGFGSVEASSSRNGLGCEAIAELNAGYEIYTVYSIFKAR